MNRTELHNLNENKEGERDILLALSQDIAAIRDKNDLFKVVSTKIRTLLSSEVFIINLIDAATRTHSVFFVDHEEIALQYPEYQVIRTQAAPVEDGVFNLVIAAEGPVTIDIPNIMATGKAPNYVQMWHKMGRRQMVAMALNRGGEHVGMIWVYSQAKVNETLFKGLSAQLSIAIANILDNELLREQLSQINSYKEQLEEEKQYLQEEIVSVRNASDLIGDGPEMQNVFQLLSQVAYANSTVLLLGETGTGKELVAREIHQSSPRRDKLMVKVNCAAMPANLIESELFGHEKGAFTGAYDRRIGKFELANKGTLFLDEIGEMPLELQVKLLRALQEKEIERIGANGTIKVDVRIIAATNRNLLKEVQAGRFRSDLYYRLNVFPITLPPLRDRKGDIPVLVRHFIGKYARNTGKKVTSISHRALDELLAYSWPGNVRELEHYIERCVLLATGLTIRETNLPPMDQRSASKLLPNTYLKTLEENERDHILEVLKRCNGKVFGIGGAAQILGVPVSTLNSKMKKLGITRKRTGFSKKD
jgi:formate hydrogenlyase transcriptional activator